MRMLYARDIDYENLESLKDNMFNKIDVLRMGLYMGTILLL